MDVRDLNIRVTSALEKAKKFIEELTVDSAINLPAEVVTGTNRFFSWDNEHRSKENGAPYLYSWSYYNGVIFEGLKDIYEKTGEDRYLEYVREYLDAMIEDNTLNDHAGYVPYHGVDCYKTASLLADFCESGEDGSLLDNAYSKTAAGLYRDLVTENKIYTEESLGGNYWHCWADKKAPLYKVWLDGIYMAQPFLAKFAAKLQDKEELERIYRRFCWVAENMQSPNGLYYHAANRKEDVCCFFWLRAIGWYAMAQVDVMEYLPEEYLPEMKKNLTHFVDSMLVYQDDSGMWTNLVDQPVSETNRTETSGTAMMVYCILKAVRLGWIDDSQRRYSDAAKKAFCYMTEEKCNGSDLKDIYLMASASGQNNYEKIDWYKKNEGKGVGPYIMAYAEILASSNVPQ